MSIPPPTRQKCLVSNALARPTFLRPYFPTSLLPSLTPLITAIADAACFNTTAMPEDVKRSMQNLQVDYLHELPKVRQRFSRRER